MVRPIRLTLKLPDTVLVVGTKALVAGLQLATLTGTREGRFGSRTAVSSASADSPLSGKAVVNQGGVAQTAGANN